MLRALLREKERLVEVLTERLEQTAEQLDRARRTGNRDRIGGGAVSIPPELVDGQREVLEELHEAIDEWRHLHGTTTLGQIEMQIAELRDLIAGQVLSRVSPAADLYDAGPAHAAPRDEQPIDFSSFARSLEGTGAPQPAEDEQELDPGEEPPLPEPVDFDTATTETLVDAIRVRNEYVAWLIRKLRMERARKDGPIDVAALANAPEELRERLTALIGRMEENLRLAEIEFSMERARIAREEAKLRLREDQVRRLARKYELAGNGQAPDEDEADRQGGNRWLRMLGLGREEDGPAG